MFFPRIIVLCHGILAVPIPIVFLLIQVLSWFSTMWTLLSGRKILDGLTLPMSFHILLGEGDSKNCANTNPDSWELNEWKSWEVMAKSSITDLCVIRFPFVLVVNKALSFSILLGEGAFLKTVHLEVMRMEWMKVMVSYAKILNHRPLCNNYIFLFTITLKESWLHWSCCTLL